MKRFGLRMLLFLFVFLAVGAVFLSVHSWRKDVDVDSIAPIAATRVLVGTSHRVIVDIAKNVVGDRADVSLYNSFDDFIQKTSSRKNPKIFFTTDQEVLENNNSNNHTSVRKVKLAYAYPQNLSYQPIIEISWPSHGEDYFWISFGGAQNIAQQIAREVGESDGVNKVWYLSNAYEYSITLANARREALSALAPFVYDNVVLERHLFDSVAADLSLDVAGIFDIPPPDQRDALFMEYLIKKLKEHKTRLVLVDTSFPVDEFKEVFDQAGTAVAVLDPWGDGREGTYLDLLRYNLSEILRGLR